MSRNFTPREVVISTNMDYHGNVTVAHITDDGRVHTLKEHLVNTAQRASVFAEEFGAAGWGRLAGLWHVAGRTM